ncbi:tRNA (cytidine/uridine-2'-O-)-methyltransferase TrmJ [Dissulfurispira thermophila]|uniref:tRNA (cytidine/uridine-2'-O-)-methyltransferase TrmJ n=2 Tax=root TaxID=1 RepID=A0A7G1H3X0_9BACT|nr:RNA methyltransferase [Dissulfurispira thermophila]BCB96842.1 tRNA (cytidine/uridine-2'-O-)-methyltransferase TrmJ [Dissulfurispira thermophila]
MGEDVMKNWKDNIYFVLVEPKESGNIGASARAIKNMGFKNLCLVNPPSVITDEAKWFACNALDVLESAKIFNSLIDAIKDKSIIVGTSRRKGRRRGLFLNVEEGSEWLYDIALSHKVAILFGREDKGLYNEEVEVCGFLITIPTSKEQPSLNLAQSVLIVAYELSKVEYKKSTEDRTQKSRYEKISLIDYEQLAVIYGRISETLKLLEYIPKGDRNLEKKIMQNLKHFIGRSGITDWELKMLHGICSQIEKKCK